MKYIREDLGMYGLYFELDIEQLKLMYGEPWGSAYTEIGKLMKRMGYTQKWGLWVNPVNDIVKNVLTVQELSRELPWLKGCLKESAVLKIDFASDLNDVYEDFS